MSPIEAFERAVAAPGTDAGAICAALHRLADALVGARLFTLMAFDGATREASRVYTSDPVAYPVSGTKPAPENAWSARVLDRRETFVANDLAGIAAVFPDHALIDSLGCRAVLNLPIVLGGRVLGTVNCLDRAGRYTPARVAAARALRLPGTVAFLARVPDRPPRLGAPARARW